MQAHSTCSLWATFCLQHSVVLPVEILEIRNYLLSLTLPKTRQTSGASLRMYGPFRCMLHYQLIVKMH